VLDASGGAVAVATDVGELESAPILLSASSPSPAPMATKQPAVGEVQTVGVAGEPRLSPEPGVFGGDTEVTLRCDTPGATIHYTFDGSQPGASSPVYSAPISVKGTALTIKAFASVPGKRDSAVVTGIYRIRE
jgi:hypothetical protein